MLTILISKQNPSFVTRHVGNQCLSKYFLFEFLGLHEMYRADKSVFDNMVSEKVDLCIFLINVKIQSNPKRAITTGNSDICLL